jgi:hypothetical protein
MLEMVPPEIDIDDVKNDLNLVGQLRFVTHSLDADLS